jgi:phage terminase small subunit
MKKAAAISLQKSITHAARSAFSKLRAAHPKETFYAFALYTNDEANSITASANTEEGLRRRAERYEMDEKKGIEQHAERLRWNPPDWAYHCAGDDQFEEAQKQLDALADANDLDEDECEKEFDARLAVFIAALKELDAEGFFGRGKERQKVTLLVAMGDQEVKLLLKCAQQLNPHAVYQKFSRVFLRPSFGKFKGIGSRKVYETTEVVLSHNGKLLACAGTSMPGWSSLFAFCLPDCTEVMHIGIKETISLKALCVSRNANFLFAGWEDLAGKKKRGIRCWDVEKKKLLWDVPAPREVWSMDISTDGNVLAVGSMDGPIYLLSAANGDLIRKVAGHSDWVQCIRFSPTDKILASVDREKCVRLWDVDDGKQVGQIQESGDSIAFSPDGQFLAIATGFAKGKDYVSIWDVPRRKHVAKLDAVENSKFQVIQGPCDFNDCQASAVAFSADGRFIAVARSWPGSAVLWNWRAGKELTWMNPDYEDLNEVVFLPDGKTIAVAGRSMGGPPLLLWDVSDAIEK